MRRVIPLLAIVVAGCAAQATPADGLAPSTWRFVSIDGKAPASDRARLTLADEKLGANLGCNSIGGPWRIEKDRLMAGPLIQTEKFCTGETVDQEKAAGALLVAAPEIKVEGNRMELRSFGHAAELERLDPSQRNS
ncbi:MAG TPA: META domain-containing protein [Sphingomonadaceae bacterium]